MPDRTLPRVRLHEVLAGKQVTGPVVIECRTFDIPNTIVGMIRNFPGNVIAVSLRPEGGSEMIAAAERTARRRGIRIIWVPKRRAGMPPVHGDERGD